MRAARLVEAQLAGSGTAPRAPSIGIGLSNTAAGIGLFSDRARTDSKASQNGVIDVNQNKYSASTIAGRSVSASSVGIHNLETDPDPSRLVGFITARADPEPFLSWIWRLISGADNREGYIMTLGVLPGEREKGAGAALIRAAVRALRDRLQVALVSLHCLQANQRVRALYSRLGFHEGAHIAEHYVFDGRAHTAVHMTLTLANCSWLHEDDRSMDGQAELLRTEPLNTNNV
jgi:ribosomal protein S18 acetylase RimI-like enzyme